MFDPSLRRAPGAMLTVTLLTENYSRSFMQQIQTIGVVVITLARSSWFLASAKLTSLMPRAWNCVLRRLFKG